MLEINTTSASIADIEAFMSAITGQIDLDVNNGMVACRINSEDWVIEGRKHWNNPDVMLYFFTKGNLEQVQTSINEYNKSHKWRDTFSYNSVFTHIRTDGTTKPGESAMMEFSDMVLALSRYI